MPRLFIISVLLMIFPIAFPQQYPGLEKNADNSNNPFSFSIESISFFKNNEYFNPITEGYTLTGSHIRPLLIWNPASDIEIKGGVLISIWSGHNSNPIIKPVFSSKFQIDKRTSLTLGSLDNSNRHKLYDPLYSTEKIYTAFQEEGLQFIYKGSAISTHTWVNWESFIFHGDNKREELTFGESFSYMTPASDGRLRLRLPFQLLIKHRGGQISNYADPVETHINVGTGAELIIGTGDNGNGGTTISALFFAYHSPKELPGIPFQNGKALLLKGRHTFNKIDATAGLWFSDNWYSPNGNMIFSSLSDYQTGVTIPRRTLLTGSIYYVKSWDLEIVSLILGLDWYYDLKKSQFDHAMTLHIKIPEKVFGIGRKNQ